MELTIWLQTHCPEFFIMIAMRPLKPAALFSSNPCPWCTPLSRTTRSIPSVWTFRRGSSQGRAALIILFYQNVSFVITLMGPRIRCFIAPNSLWPMFLKYFHDSILSAYLWTLKTFCKIAVNFYWPGMRKEVFGLCSLVWVVSEGENSSIHCGWTSFCWSH